jgi:hypothetical protein
MVQEEQERTYHCHITSYHIMSYHIMSYHVMSYHVTSYHIMLYHVTSYHIISCHIISYHVISYHIISCHIISYHVISYHIISCHIISYHVISYHIISYHIISRSWSTRETRTGPETNCKFLHPYTIHPFGTFEAKELIHSRKKIIYRLKGNIFLIDYSTMDRNTKYTEINF